MVHVNHTKFKQVAFLAAREAGKILRRDFPKNKEVRFKEDHSIVTKTDLEADRVILNIIRHAFPVHAIISEESGGALGRDYTWLIDPLDGTTNFVRRVPLFSVSFALLFRGSPILSVVFNPVLDEFYFAQIGRGAFLNDRRIIPSTVRELSISVILFNKGRGARNFLRWLSLLRRVGRHIPTIRAFGSANLEACQVARGTFEGYINLGSSSWDLIPSSCIIRESGGRISNIEGGTFNFGSSTLLATNGKIHNKILTIINEKRR